MASSLDLCSVQDVRDWLNLNQPAAVVDTFIAADIQTGSQTVTPADMTNIQIGARLVLDAGGNIPETIAVTDITGTTFTADFKFIHTGPVSVVDWDNRLFSRLIRSAGAVWLWRLGMSNPDGSAPTASPLTKVLPFNRWYDGPGGDRLFLRDRPVQTVSAVTVNGVAVPASTSSLISGYVIDESRKSIAIRISGVSYRRGNSYRFSDGIQNVNVVGTAGYAVTPFDIRDACTEMVGLNYSRRGWIDRIQQQQSDSIGMVKFQSWELPPRIVAVMENYRRLSQ